MHGSDGIRLYKNHQASFHQCKCKGEYATGRGKFSSFFKLWGLKRTENDTEDLLDLLGIIGRVHNGRLGHSGRRRRRVCNISESECLRLLHIRFGLGLAEVARGWNPESASMIFFF